MITKILSKIFPCRFNESACYKNVLGCKCGKSKKSEAPAPQAAPPPPVAPVQEQAKDIYQTRLQYDPLEAEKEFKIAASPEYGLLPTTRLTEDVRKEVFPLEQSIREQLGGNILQNLQGGGITPEQRQAIAERRMLAQGELVKSLRDRANLGGGLYGGRAAEEESRAVSDLQRAFAEEDVTREERAFLNSIQSAIPYLQLLFPNVGITSPQFTSPVQAPETYASSLLNQRGQNANVAMSNAQLQAQAQQAAAANRTALYTALIGGAGKVAGAYAGKT